MNGKITILWQIQPDGRYWENGDGFGMSSINYIVKHYGGVCSVQQQDGKFVLNILIPI